MWIARRLATGAKPVVENNPPHPSAWSVLSRTSTGFVVDWWQKRPIMMDRSGVADSHRWQEVEKKGRELSGCCRMGVTASCSEVGGGQERVDFADRSGLPIMPNKSIL